MSSHCRGYPALMMPPSLLPSVLWVRFGSLWHIRKLSKSLGFLLGPLPGVVRWGREGERGKNYLLLRGEGVAHLFLECVDDCRFDWGGPVNEMKFCDPLLGGGEPECQSMNVSRFFQWNFLHLTLCNFYVSFIVINFSKCTTAQRL